MSEGSQDHKGDRPNSSIIQPGGERFTINGGGGEDERATTAGGGGTTVARSAPQDSEAPPPPARSYHGSFAVARASSGIGPTSPTILSGGGGGTESGLEQRRSATVFGAGTTSTAAVSAATTAIAHPTSPLQSYVDQLIQILTDENQKAVVEELERLVERNCSPRPLSYQSFGTARFLILKSLVGAIRSLTKNDTDKKKASAGTCARTLFDQVLRSNCTDLYCLVEHLHSITPRPLEEAEGAGREAQGTSLTFEDLLEDWIPGDLYKTNNSCFGVALAASFGVCANKAGLSSNSGNGFLESALNFLEGSLASWLASGTENAPTAASSEHRYHAFWWKVALEVLAVQRRRVSWQKLIATSTADPNTGVGGYFAFPGSIMSLRGNLNNNGGTTTDTADASSSAGPATTSMAHSLSNDLYTSPEDLIRVLKELGPGCSSSATTFRDTLRETTRISGSLEGRVFGEQTLARLLWFLAVEAVASGAVRSGSGANSGDPSSSAQDEEISNILVGTFIPNSMSEEADGEANSERTGDSVRSVSAGTSGANGGKWDLDVIRTCLAEDYGHPNRDWDAVARYFDFGAFFVENQNQLLVLLDLYQAGARRRPKSHILLSAWHNGKGQLSLLAKLAVAPPGVYTFALNDAERSDLVALGIDAKSASSAWACGDFLERLIQLSDQPHLESAVRDVIIQGLMSCPGAMLCCLVRLQIRQQSLGGTGQETGRAGMVMKNEMMENLVPYFFKPNSNSPVRFLSAAIKRMWTISPAWVATACAETYRGTATSPPKNRLAVALHIVGIIRLLGPESTAPIINNNEDVEFSITMAVIAADQDLIQLQPWLTERFAAGGLSFLLPLIGFLGTNYSSSKPRPPRSEDGSVQPQAEFLSLENLATALKALQGLDVSILSQPIPSIAGISHGAAESSSSATIGDSVKALTEVCATKHPSLRSEEGGSDDIEEMANSYFQKIYTSENGVTEVVEMLKKFKVSGSARENDIFACMIHNLFDEYRFFSKYPEKELRITGILFGMLIKEQLVSSITLGIALRYVLEALRKTPGDGTNSNSGKMFRFGMFALEQFKERLHEWPQYCSHIVQIPHLKQGYADLVAEIDHAMEESTRARVQAPPAPSSVGMPGESKPPAGDDSGLHTPSLPGSIPSSPRSHATSDHEVDQALGPKSRRGSEDDPMPVPNGILALPSDGPGGAAVPGGSGFDLTTDTLSLHNRSEDEERTAVFGPGLGRAVTVTDNETQHDAPSDAIVDRVQFIINNMSPSNVESKAQELKDLLPTDHFGWLGNYLVVKRISTQPNFHSLYLSFLDQLGDYGMGLVQAILASVYVNVGKLLRSPKITTSTSERSLLKNLGSWLGQITLARNRPILQITLDCKELLYQGYETGMLIAVTPFVAKILEGAKNSFVFRPPNPWLMGLLGVFRSLYDVDDLKMNIKFEVEVLCKNLGLKVDDIPPRTRDLQKRIPPVKEKNPDFNVKSSGSGTITPGGPGSAASSVGSNAGPSSMPLSPGKKELNVGAAVNVIGVTSLIAPDGQGQLQDAGSAGSSFQGGTDQQDTVIPNLAAYVTIPPNVGQLFQQVQGGSSISEAVLKRTVPIAVDRAIREIIQPIVERSVTISCMTTKEIVQKDFAMESDENKMRKAAQFMVANLAGSLALVTCREPLRGSVSTHLRQLLLSLAGGTSNGGSSSSSNANVNEHEQAAIEQCVTICASDNLDLGCMLIEKAATEKAVRDMDEALAPALQARRESREQNGQPFYDMSIFRSGSSRYPAALPDPLRPKPGGLRPEQLLVYEAFQRLPRHPAVPGAVAAQNASTLSTTAGGVRSPGNGPVTTGTPSGNVPHHQLGLESLSALASKLNSAVTTLLSAAGPRAGEITLSMIPLDHEIRQLLLAVKRAASSAQASGPLSSVETDAVLAFAQGVFKRLYELSLSEPLRLEALVGLLEGLSECCPQLSQDMGTWATYAPTGTDAQRKLHLTILLLLVRSHLVPVAEVDDFLAKSMNGGRSTIWLDFSLLFVRTAIVERIAGAADMPKAMDILTKVAEGRALGAPQTTAYVKPISRFLEEVTTASGGASVGGSVGGASNTEQQQQQQQQAEAAAPVTAIGGEIVGVGDKVERGQTGSAHSSLLGLAEATKRAAEATAFTARNDPPGMRQQVTFLLDNWLRTHSEAQGNEKVLLQYLQLLQQHGVMKMEDQTERFFRFSTELVVEAVSKSAQPATGDVVGKSGVHGTVLNYTVADAYSKLIVLLMRYMNGGGSPEQASVQRVALLNTILGITVRTMMTTYERSKQNPAVGNWDQRPWFRILLNLVQDLSAPSPVFDHIRFGTLSVFGSAFHVIQPLVLPGFAFAWLELVSHRMFLSNLLLTKDQKGWGLAHQLLIDLFLFLEPHLRKTELTEAIKHLYKGTLRVVLVLLHDFPSFLSGYHLSLSNVIPDNCVQLRNLVLSAFPRGMVLPDPFTPNLKIDLLPEMSKSPMLLSNVAGPLGSIRGELDSYLESRHPSHFVPQLLPRLYKDGSNEIDIPRVNSLVLYVGIQAIARLQNSQIAHTPEMEVMQKLMDFDDRGRYISLNAIANQLRYPSNHTHYFSCVMLFLFSEAKDEAVKEQITRVLLERLIVHRPHPWGLLITFIELIKNQRYQFWSHPFTRCATEIEKVFDSVARSCLTPGSRAGDITQ